MRILFPLLLLSGCSITYVHPDRDNDDMVTDWTDCGEVGKEKALSLGKVEDGPIFKYTDQCMLEKGWTRTMK